MPPPSTGVDETSTDPVTNSSVVSPDAMAAELANVATVIARVHGTFDSFATTATVKRRSTAASGTVTEDPDVITDFVLRNDGSLWSSGSDLIWAAYDASTGIARSESVDRAGVHHFQEVAGWGGLLPGFDATLGGNSVTPEIGVKFNPVFQPGAARRGMSVDEVDEGGRPAWKIVFGSPGLTADFTVASETYVIDQATGLVLRQIQTHIDSGVETVFEQVLSNIQLGGALPPEFPGAFPPGANVDVSGDPAGFRMLDLPGAIAQFGPHVVLPANLSTTARFWVDTGASPPTEDGEPGSNRATLFVDIPLGFSRASMTIMTEVPVMGEPLPEGTILVDGLICKSADGTTCDTIGQALAASTDTSLLTGGDLAGQPATTYVEGIYIDDGPRLISIHAPTRQVWEAMANSLERVSG